MIDKKEFEEEALAEFIEITGIPKERVDQYGEIRRVEFQAYGETYELKNPGLVVIFKTFSDGFLPVLYFPKNHQDISEPVLSHSEITGLIYVYFGGEKYEITKAAIEAVEAIKALEQEPTTKNCRSCRNQGSHNGICEICKDNKCWTEKEPTTKNDLADGKDNNVTSKEDAISRQEAIDTIRQLYIDLATQKYVIDLLKVLPSVTPQEPRWILVSERLPKAEYGESDSVLVCLENGTQDVLYFDGSNWRYPTGESYISVNHKNGWHNKVIAWMPLPKPYEPQESEES